MKQLPIIQLATNHSNCVAIRAGDDSWTYADLINGSANVARELLNGRDDLHESRVAYLVSPGADYVCSQWGIWRAGGVAVPLSLSATEKELEYSMQDAKVDIALTDRSHAGKLGPLCSRLDCPVLIVDDITSVSEASSPSMVLPAIEKTRRAMMLYTSGTTNQPKGVVTTHACIEAQIATLVDAWCWQASDRIPLFLPLHHIHGIINVLSCALCSGAEVDVFPRFEAESILSRVADDAYTVFMAVPTIYVKLIEKLESLSESDRIPIIAGFANMRLMVSGSAALPASVHEKWTQLTGQRLLERYGMTEIGMALSNPYVGERRPGHVGQPLPGVEIRLQSGQGDSITDEGVAGEIQVRGSNVFLEYWNRPEATIESFCDGWFRTGDIAVLDRGAYRIMGRSSVDIIKSGGYKLSALEIEASLLDHPSICECAVVGIPDLTWGERVAVAVVLIENGDLDLPSLQSWCQSRISSYKTPRQLLTVTQLPRNAMGKVTKPAVVELFV